MSMRFWVVGGEYTDTSFERLVDGSERVLGPFSDRDQAMNVWKRVAEATRSDCYARFTIAQEP